ADPRGAAFAALLARHAYERHVASEVDALLLARYREIVRVILTDYADLTPAARARTALLYGQIQRLVGDGYADVERLVLREMGAYAGLEADVAQAELASYFARSPYADGVDVTTGLLTRAQVVAVAELPIQGLTIGEWFRGQAASMTIATRQQIQLGLLAGEGPATIVRRIVGARGQTEPDVWRRARRDATAVVRTTVTATHTAAAQATYEAAGPDVVDRYAIDAVMDARTTVICISLDGTIHRVDDPTAPRPPFHPNCRTTVKPLLAEAMAARLGLPADGIAPRHRFADYGSWLSTQSESVQNRVLGRPAAGLWRAKKLSLRDLVGQDRRVLTLAQLAERLGVDRAGLRGMAA
ncbi:MAG: minor capsid protein, partial [Georgenia sp.]